MGGKQSEITSGPGRNAAPRAAKAPCSSAVEWWRPGTRHVLKLIEGLQRRCIRLRLGYIEREGFELLLVESQQASPIRRHKQIQFQIFGYQHIAFPERGAGNITVPSLQSTR